MVAKWERGVKGVSRRYRELLCLLVEVTVDQLGLGPAASCPTPSRPQVADHLLVSLLYDAAGLLDQLGTAGTVLALQMLAVWKDAVTSRRTLFVLLDPAATDPAGHARAATATVAEWEQLAQRYQGLYATVAPAALLTPVAAHVHIVSDALRRNPGPAERRRLQRNLAHVATLGGRLAFDDLGDAMSGHAYSGHAYYSLAFDTAGEAGHDPLAAVAYGYAAQLAATEGHLVAALGHLTAAGRHAKTAGPSVASWLATTEASIQAEAGNLAPAARDALDLARAVGGQAATDATPAGWGDHHTARLAATCGHVLLRTGDYRRARVALAEALDQLDPRTRRPRVLCLIDHATLELHTGNPTEACALATQVADLLSRTPYATGTTRLRAFRATADHALDSRALRALDEHLARIAA